MIFLRVRGLFLNAWLDSNSRGFHLIFRERLRDFLGFFFRQSALPLNLKQTDRRKMRALVILSQFFFTSSGNRSLFRVTGTALKIPRMSTCMCVCVYNSSVRCLFLVRNSLEISSFHLPFVLNSVHNFGETSAMPLASHKSFPFTCRILWDFFFILFF